MKLIKIGLEVVTTIIWFPIMGLMVAGILYDKLRGV